jgi:regulator of replication initiation timing
MEIKIKTEEQTITKTNRQIKRLNELLSDVEEKEVLIITTRKISSLEKELSNKISDVSSLKIELEKLRQKYSNTELQNTYINIKEKVFDFFNNMETESRRNELLMIIKKSVIFGQYILIDTGILLFLFDLKNNNKFDRNLLKNLDKDIIYKDYFIEYPQKNKKEVRKFNKKLISNFVLDKDTKDGRSTRVLVRSYLANELGIDYKLPSEYKSVIAFMNLKGIYSKGDD